MLGCVSPSGACALTFTLINGILMSKTFQVDCMMLKVEYDKVSLPRIGNKEMTEFQNYGS